MADVNSVPEMLKLAKLIYDAWRALKANSSLGTTDQGEGDIDGDSADSGIDVANGFDKNMVHTYK